MRITINGLARPLAVEGATDVVELLASITAGWRMRPAETALPPAIGLRRRAGGYAITAALRPGVVRERTVVSAACSLVVDIAEALADQRPDLLCLHAGAVRTAGGLVVFPSRRRAGKSTLVARLACLGAPVFADDILPLAARGEHLDGLALGVASRLRLPLPAGLAPAFRRWCAVSRGPGDRHYRYLAPAATGLAAYGERAPVRAFVFLDRVPGAATPVLARVDRAAALEALLLQNFGMAAAASTILGRLEQLTRACGLYVLHYSALDPAAALLLRRFGGEALPLPEALAPLPAPPPTPRPGRPAPLAGPLQRAPGDVVRQVDGRPFLADDANGAVFALAGVGGALWELLAAPIDQDTIASTLARAFPAVPEPVIRADVAAFLGALAERRLIRSVRPLAGPAPAAPTPRPTPPTNRSPSCHAV